MTWHIRILGPQPEIHTIVLTRHTEARTHMSAISKRNTYYQYNIANGYFEATNSFPASCTLRSPASGSGNLCINLNDSTPKEVTGFVAKGNYLNWLTASKFDVEKKILTGGKYLDGKLISESRGCVGRGFVKKALTADYVEGGTNTSLGVTFSVRGAPNLDNYSAPSPGGQTELYIYLGDYHQGDCQAAIDAFTSGAGQQDIRTAVLACLTSQSGGELDLATKQKVLYNESVQECWQYSRVTPHTVGNDAFSNIKNSCPDIYESRGAGPSSILAGDADLLCSETYVGACYVEALPMAHFWQFHKRLRRGEIQRLLRSVSGRPRDGSYRCSVRYLKIMPTSLPSSAI